MEAERHPVGDGAPPPGALPPVAAGDGAAVKVRAKHEEESPWKRRSEMARLELGSRSNAEELNDLAAEKSDLQMTLI